MINIKLGDKEYKVQEAKTNEEIIKELVRLPLLNKMSFFNAKKDEIKVVLTPNMDISLLPRDEIIIYQMLEKVSSNKEFTMKEFEKYCKNHSSSFI